MIFTASNVAIKSTPHFQLTLQDGDRTYYPESVLYQVQAQVESTLEWVKVGETKSIVPTSNVIDFYLESSQTDLVEGCTLVRRLIIQVNYTDKGQTLSSTQSIEFTLADLPILSETYEGDVFPEYLPSIAGTTVLSGMQPPVLRLDLNNPIHDVLTAEVGIPNAETHEVTYEAATTYILSGNSSILLFCPESLRDISDVYLYVKLKVTTLKAQKATTIDFNVKIS